MSFKYINPGYINLLNQYRNGEQVVGSTYSKTGVAYSQTNSNINAGISLPSFVKGDDFWARFDCYIPDIKDFSIHCYAPYTDVKAGIAISVQIMNSSLSKILVWRDNQTHEMVSGAADDVNIKIGGINTFAFHAVYDETSQSSADSNSLIEVFFNAKKYTSLPGKPFCYSTTNSLNTVRLYSTQSGVYFSNIIFSSEDITKEQLTLLPISGTETDMTLGENGIYVADAADQTILQSVNVTDLITNYGAGSKVTGISVVGNPAYKTATGLAKLTGISKSGNTVTTHGTVNLSSDTSAFVMDSWSLSDTTITDLQNMKFGWKVS